MSHLLAWQPSSAACKLKLGLQLLLLCICVQCVHAKPNIVLIITDDQGYGDLGVTGNPVLDTPCLDGLAAQSVSFERFYVSPVCTPTRASLMTGRYHHRTGAIDTWKGRSMMRAEEVTIAEVLRDSGYATGIFGKWHLGDCYPFRAQDQGFDHALVHRGGGLGQPSEPIENQRRYTDPILFRNGEEVQTKGYCTDVYFDEAIGFIEKQSRAGKPFFTYIATNAPHDPYHDVPEELYKKYKTKDLAPVLLGNAQDADTVARVFAMVENIDQNVGRLMSALDRLELAEDTIVVFMLDNGPNTQRYVGPMRGKKTQVHDGGVRSPLFVRYPGQLEAQLRVKQTAAHIDIMPTLLDLASVAVPETLRMDGLSLRPLMQGGDGADWPQRAVVMQAHRGSSPERLHNCMVIQGRWKLVRPSSFHLESAEGQTPIELYDIQADPTESQDLAAANPEVVAQLQRAYHQWFADVVPEHDEPLRIVVGSEHEPVTVLTRQDWHPIEGEGWGKNGRWLVHAKQAGRYHATLLLLKPIDHDAVVTLYVGEKSYEGAIRKGASRVRIESVEAPAGDFEILAAIGAGKQAQGPWQIEWAKR